MNADPLLVWMLVFLVCFVVSLLVTSYVLGLKGARLVRFDGGITYFRQPSGDITDIDGNLRQPNPTECPKCHRKLRLTTVGLGLVFRDLYCPKHHYFYRLPPLEDGIERIHEYCSIPPGKVTLHGPYR